jgi:hypothetical protein
MEVAAHDLFLAAGQGIRRTPMNFASVPADYQQIETIIDTILARVAYQEIVANDDATDRQSGIYSRSQTL